MLEEADDVVAREGKARLAVRTDEHPHRLVLVDRMDFDRGGIGPGLGGADRRMKAVGALGLQFMEG